MDKSTETKKFYHSLSTLSNSHESSTNLQRAPKTKNKKPVIVIGNEKRSGWLLNILNIFTNYLLKNLNNYLIKLDIMIWYNH